MKITIEQVELSANIIQVRSAVDTLGSVASDIGQKRKSGNSGFLHLPRLSTSLEIQNIRLRISLDYQQSHPMPTLEFVSNGCGFTGGVSYSSRWDGPRHVSDSTEVRRLMTVADAAFEYFIRPATVSSVPSSAPGIHATIAGAESEPIILLATTDGYLSGTAQTLQESGDTLIDMNSWLFSMTAISDDLSINIWSRSSVDVLAGFLRYVQPSSRPVQRFSRHDPWELSMSFFLSLDHISLCVTGRDINPSCNLDLARGIYVTLRGSIEFWHNGNLLQEFQLKGLRSRTLTRQRFGLTDELYSSGLSSQTKTPVATQFAVSLRHVSVRRTISNPFDAAITHFEPWDKESVASDGDSILKIGLISVKVSAASANTQGDNMVDLPKEFVATIDHALICLEMLNIYSVLLASKTLSDISTLSSLHNEEPPTLHVLPWRGRVNVRRVHLDVSLPSDRRLFLNARALSLTFTHSSLRQCKVQLLAAYVPSPSHSCRWERLGSVQECQLDTREALAASQHRVNVRSLHVQLPWKYILADVILDLNVSFKATRQLFHNTFVGIFQDVPAPHDEPSKLIFPLHIRIISLYIAFRDDPFESQLRLIWATGQLAQRIRLQREAAFEAKAASLRQDGDACQMPDRWTSRQTLSEDDARRRLNEAHSISWLQAFRQAQLDRNSEERNASRSYSGPHELSDDEFSFPFRLKEEADCAPLMRLSVRNLQVQLSPPPENVDMSAFLHQLGGDQPARVKFSLSVPSLIELSATCVNIGLRDYPLPLLNIPELDSAGVAITFKGMAVLAEELGPSSSVQWMRCVITRKDADMIGANAFSLLVPKTHMPVKIYADLQVDVLSDSVIDFTWGVSYMPAMQCIAKVFDSFTHAPNDCSPPLGFWDKMRLIFHTRLMVMFKSEAQLHLKGSRDPYALKGEGNGFCLCWRGNPILVIGVDNDKKELVQLTSDSMLIVVPDLSRYSKSGGYSPPAYSLSSTPSDQAHSSKFHEQHHCLNRFKKVVANFTGGIRLGVGLVLERACREECPNCSGDPFDRKCRLFAFKSHYDVILRATSTRGPDSYQGFRSDFAHLSFSLICPTSTAPFPQEENSSVHLTPLTFAHFWHWLQLFDSSMSLPIGQGSLYPDARPPSPKFSKHIATIKYKISVSNLLISHVYKLDTIESWNSGETHFVGIKLRVAAFSADLHQREEVSTIKHSSTHPIKVRHKKFNAAKVIISDATLRVMFARSLDPEKLMLRLPKKPASGRRQPWSKSTPLELTSPWASPDDWREIDDSYREDIKIYSADIGQCPRFIYFKTLPSRTALTNLTDSVIQAVPLKSRFTDEGTYGCEMGSANSVQNVQIELATIRLQNLQASGTDVQRQVEHIRDYIRNLEATKQPVDHLGHSASMSSQTEPSGSHNPSPEEWDNFENVYQIYSPSVSVNNVTRDLMMQYYYASRARRGFEYHMATRAVKFIRDQASTQTAEGVTGNEEMEARNSTFPHAAAQAFRKLLIQRRDEARNVDDDGDDFSFEQLNSILDESDPSIGWIGREVSIRRGHFCLMLQPQVLLQSERTSNSVIVLTAMKASLQNFAVLDNANTNDPVNGLIMNRTYAALNGLQIFAPKLTDHSDRWHHDSVPLEVLVEIHCETPDFELLVPQTDARLHYDKFNRLRLQNIVNTLEQNEVDGEHRFMEHIRYQTDLVTVNAPRVTVSADCDHFISIANVVTNVLLYSDPIYQRRAEELATYLIQYDFHDLTKAADLVVDYQNKIRELLAMIDDVDHEDVVTAEPRANLVTELHAQLLVYGEELNNTFEAIKLAQETANGIKRVQDLELAFRLLAWSTELSWQMLEGSSQHLAKLGVKEAFFSWLSRKDSSTVSRLTIKDMQAFDGSPDAIWPDILSKHNEPSNHPLVKRGNFMEVDWCILPPVGGISIYEYFVMHLHPVRLQIQTSLGTKIMEYVWPSRIDRSADRLVTRLGSNPTTSITQADTGSSTRAILESDDHFAGTSLSHGEEQSRRLEPSRSYTDLSKKMRQPALKRSQSFSLQNLDSPSLWKSDDLSSTVQHRSDHDALVMRNRSTQKSFILVQISSLHLVLSVQKEDTFLCREAKIRTRELVFRNQTWSFEDLADQFIPSDPSWKGWIKMALHQPLLPVLPVAKELISKTKWGSLATKSTSAPVETEGGQKTDSERHAKQGRKREARSSRKPAVFWMSREA